MEQSFIHKIEAQCVAHPEALAVRTDRLKLSYRQLWQQVTQLRKVLCASGARRIAVALPNSAAWIALDLATVLEGILFVPVPHFFSTTQFQHLILDAGIDLIIREAGTDSSQDALKNKQSDVCLDHELSLIPVPRHNDAPKFSNNISDNDAFKISYTSGTTGDPKGVLISLSLISKTVNSILSTLDPSSAQRHLSVLPFSLLLENIIGVYAVLASGGCCHVPSFEKLGLIGSSSVDWEKFSAVIAATRPTSMITVPALLQGLLHCRATLKLDTQSLQFIAVGGAPLSKTLLMQAEQLGLPVFQGYGMTECGSVVCLNTPSENRPGSVGKPLPHIKIHADKHKQLIITGLNFPGYANQAGSAVDGKWTTGDLGYVDDDGFVYVTARKHSTYSTAFGRNVSPEWVESELDSEAVIAQSVVFGAGQKHNIAVVVGARPDIDNTLIDQSIAQANQRLPDYARIASWIRAEQPFSELNQQRSAAGTLQRTQIYRDYHASIESKFTQALS